MAAKRASYVKCRVSLGFFDTEFYVIVDDSSAYVDRSSVKLERAPDQLSKEVEGLVLAYIIDEQRDRALIELPGQAVIGGLRTWVPKANLATA
jgi:hypothetical protein